MLDKAVPAQIAGAALFCRALIAPFASDAIPWQRLIRGNSVIQRLIISALLVVLLGGGAAAQQPPQPQLPDNLKITILIKNTLIALNNANLTGNYSVLRDLASPGFAQANNPARLAQIFQKLRDLKIDLAPTVLFKPILTKQPLIAKNGLLVMEGYFATRPEQVNFEFAFQMLGGNWKLFGLRVDTSIPKEAAAPGAGAPVPASAGNTNPAQPPPNNSAQQAAGEAVPAPARRPKAPAPRPAAPGGAKKKQDDSAWWPFGDGG